MIEGGCFCGAIRYRVEARPGRVTHCHCLHCQRTSGAAFVTWAEFEPEKLQFISGSPKSFIPRASVVRQFCGDCGSPLTYKHSDLADTIDVVVASFDDPNLADPEDHVFCDRMISWVKIADDLPRFKMSRHDEN